MSTGESSELKTAPAPPPGHRAQQLDLRLLPAALSAWAAALTGIYATADVALLWGGLMAAVGALILMGLWLVPRSSVSVMGRTALQVGMCVAVGACVLLSAGLDNHRQKTSGWTAAVHSEAPVELVLRVTADPQELHSPHRDTEPEAEPGIRAQAVVSTFNPPGESEPSRVDARVVLISREGLEPELIAGQRYRMTAAVDPSRPDDQATALVRPLGLNGPEPLQADRWSRSMAIFNELRSATADASAVGVGEAEALLPGIVLGDRSQQDAELTDAMRVAGLTHMTVVSGTHTSLVMGALLGLLRLSGAPRWSVPPVLLAGLVLYVLLVQPAPSVIRAAVMGSIGALAVFAGRGRASSALLCVCVILLLVYDPWFGANAAFR